MCLLYLLQFVSQDLEERFADLCKIKEVDHPHLYPQSYYLAFYRSLMLRLEERQSKVNKSVFCEGNHAAKQVISLQRSRVPIRISFQIGSKSMHKSMKADICFEKRNKQANLFVR
jgi:hypothetical protein